MSCIGITEPGWSFSFLRTTKYNGIDNFLTCNNQGKGTMDKMMYGAVEKFKILSMPIAFAIFQG